MGGTKTGGDTSSAKRIWWNKKVEQILKEQKREFVFCHDLHLQLRVPTTFLFCFFIPLFYNYFLLY